MRTLFVGCGNHGGHTLLPAALSAGIRITALVDTNVAEADRIARQWSVPVVHESVADVDPVDYDAVILALPITEQAAHVSWALKHRLHTFVEKPPAPNLDRLRDLADQAASSGITCCVGMNFRWADGVLALLRRLDSGQFGSARYVRVVHIARKPVASFSSDLSFEASLFHAQGIHAIDLATLLMPSTPIVSGQMVPVQRGLLCTLSGSDPDAGYRFETNFGSYAAAFSHQVDVVTDTGDMLQLRDLAELSHQPGGGAVDVADYPGARVLWRRSPLNGGYSGGGYIAELAAFADHAAGGRSARLVSIADLLPVYEAFDDLLTARGLKWTG